MIGAARTDLALDVSMLANRVGMEHRLPHSVRDEARRLAVRVIAGLSGRDVPRQGTLAAEDAEAAIAGLMDALRGGGVPMSAIAAIVNRYAERTARPEPGDKGSGTMDQRTAH